MNSKNPNNPNHPYPGLDLIKSVSITMGSYTETYKKCPCGNSMILVEDPSTNWCSGCIFFSQHCHECNKKYSRYQSQRRLSSEEYYQLCFRCQVFFSPKIDYSNLVGC